MIDRSGAITKAAFVLVIFSLTVLVSSGAVGAAPTAQHSVESSAVTTVEDAIEISSSQEITSAGNYELSNDISPSSEDSLALDPAEYSNDVQTNERSIESDNVTITLGDDSPHAPTTHDWTIQVSEEFGEVDRIELKYRRADSDFDDDISVDDLVGGNINVVGGGALEVDAVYNVTHDLWFDINDSYLAPGDTIEIAWANDVFTNPPETGTEYISMEMRDFDEDYIGSGVGTVFIPGEIELNDLEATNTDSNQLSEYQFEFSVKEHSIDSILYFHADFSDAYEDGLHFEEMDHEWDSDDFWMEDAHGNDIAGSFRGTDGEGVLRFETSADRLETDTGAGPYTVGLKNISNPDAGTDYEVELRINDTGGDTGPTAIDNATFDTVQSPTMTIEDTNLTYSTTYDPGKYEIDVEFATADAHDVDGFAVEFIDAGDIDADNLTAADIDVTDAVVDTVNTDTDEVTVKLDDPVTYQENEQATIVLDGVTNPSEIGDFDVAVEFFVNGYNYGNDTLADAFTIEPSLVVGDWESPRSVPSGSLSPNSFTVENVGEVDLTGITLFLGADSEADAFEKPATFSAIVESWFDETIDAGDTKEYEYDLVTEDYFGIDENYEIGEDFYHGPAAGFSGSWGLFEQEDADPQPFYISESLESGTITASVENETGQPVDGAQVDLYVHEVAPDNLVASEESADSTVTFDESHPDIDEGLAVGIEEAESVEYVVVADKDGYEESTQSTALYDGNHEVSEVVTITEREPATFEITRFDILETDVQTGDEFYTLANITNTGEETGLDVARLKLDGQELENESVYLDPGERDTVSFAHDAPDEGGNYTITIETQDDIASGTLNVTEPEPATFEITRFNILETEVETGEEFYTFANITNTGEEWGYDVARLKLDGQELENESVYLDPGERDTVSFLQDAPDEEGNYTITVETQDDIVTGTLNVTEPEPATFNITRFDILETALEPGEEFYVTTNVTNTGEEWGYDVARLKLDGQELSNESVSLDPGERDTVTFAHDAPEEEGNYTISIETQDDHATEEITVGPHFQVLDADMPVDVDQGDNVTVEFVIENEGSHGTQQVNFTVYASEQDDDDDGDDEDGRIDASVAVVDDVEDTTQGEAYVNILENEFETVDLVTNENLLDEMATYDAFVIFRFDDDELAGDFLDELEPDQGVVYLDDTENVWPYIIWADGMYRLHNVRDDPGHRESITHNASGDPPEVTITAAHPIFDGVGDVGETVILNDNTEHATFGSWFGAYSGEVLAEVDYGVHENADDVDEEDVKGPGIGVNDDKNEVLLPALYHRNDLEHITPEGETLIVNSVSHVAQDVDGTVHTGATETDDSDDADDGDAEFPFFGEVVIHVWDGLTLDTGETTTIELAYEVPENLAPDLYTQELSTENDAVISELWVELHPDIEVSSYSLAPDPTEEELSVGDTLTAETVVANHGDRPGEFEVEYIVDEEVVATETVEVDADSTETVDLEHELREAGTKIISVNDVDPVQIDVEGPEADIEVESYTLDPDPADEPLYVGDTLAVEANLTNHGTASGEFEVEYIVDEEVVANETVEVDADSTEIVELDHDLRETGTKIVSVNGVDPVQIFVDPIPATYEITDVDPVEKTVEVGEEFAVAATIENVGMEDGVKDVELRRDGVTEKTKEDVTLDAGSVTTIAFENVSVLETGEYNLSVWIEDDEVNATLTVEESTDPTPTPPEDDDQEFIIGDGAGFGPVIAVLALLVAAVFARRR